MHGYEHIAKGEPSEPPSDSLTLPFDLRQKSRFLTKLDSGREIALVLPRGRVLRGGDRVRRQDGVVFEIRAADEKCSTVRAKDSVHLLRVAYHLGNRHMPLQVGDAFVRYLRDHVLDEMVRGLGAEVMHEDAPFEPEGGAYGGGHAHGHSHD
jgi:urease accessory protein